MRDGSIARYHADACSALARSCGLWKAVNAHVANCCRKALAGHRSKAWLTKNILRPVPRQKSKDEPVALDSLRGVARQIQEGAPSLTLL